MCGKRGFPSPRSAKHAHSKVRNKIRVYFCNTCHAYHVTGMVGGRHR